MRKPYLAVALAASSMTVAGLLAGCSTKSSGTGGSGSPAPSASSASSSSGAAGPSGQGVTTDSIKVGISYPDLDAVKQFINLTHGDYKVAYTAVINDINTKGGINGRKLEPVFAPVNPIGTAPADAACTKLTEDAKVFVVLGSVTNPACFLTTHTTPLIGTSVSQPQSDAAKAPWFYYNPTQEHAAVKVLDAVDKQGGFKGKKVGVVGLAAASSDVNNVVVPELKKLGVNVVQTALNSAPTTDVNAGYQQFQLIARKFQASGVDVVVAVGDAGQGWPKALQVNRSTYLPTLVATYRNALAAYVADTSGNDPAIVKGAITGDGNPPPSVSWNDPRMKSCVATIQKAEPNAKIEDPVTATAKTPNTWVAPTYACQNVSLLVDILKAAGKTVNNDTFNSGGESLSSVQLPGFGGQALHYGKDTHDGGGPVYLSTYDSAKKNLVVQPKAYQ
jgi:hypothetical protein